MNATPAKLPPAVPTLPVWRFTIDQYHRMIGAGILTPDDRCELLDGVIVPKMPNHPPHFSTVVELHGLLSALLAGAAVVRPQGPITLPARESEPEPDIAAAVGPRALYRTAAHPLPHQLYFVAEVADSSPARDRRQKLPIYAEAGIPEYWIVNLVDGRVEVYTPPTPTGYAHRRDYLPGDAVPVALAGQVVGAVPVAELLP